MNALLRTGALAGAAAAALIACATLDFHAPAGETPAARYPQGSFAVFSDAHLFLPELGMGQPSFEKTKYDDRKMFEHGLALLHAAIAGIRAARPAFVLVPGDLTKDGEEQVHLAMARELQALRADGIPVYVVPGNHDVNNPRAFRYVGNATERIPNVTPARFAEIYRDFGYGDALERDPSSLAYVAEPVPGLWLLALDACGYELNPGRTHEYTPGFFTPERLAWARSMLERARREGKAVIVMMHHGVVEHFPGQAKQFPEYLVRDRQPFARMLAQYGVHTVFTGHFHSQNVAGQWWAPDGREVRPTDAAAVPDAARFLFDLETGSLVTYPSPWRLVRIDASQVMHVRSFHVTTVEDMPEGFPAYALDYARKGTEPYIIHVLRGYGISEAEATRIAVPISNAAIAHYAGDPVLGGTEMYPTTGLSPLGSLAVSMKKDIVEGMWKGALPHADNDVDIDLSSGRWVKTAPENPPAAAAATETPAAVPAAATAP
ncbi:MAG TPA: metallophosphoesterase [Spirochaetia bacterium]|nr:metallophosphoesterase [Spirochaetia bacterium]